ncbi:12954_t:CDS:2, partial [Racocetra fulgida]
MTKFVLPVCGVFGAVQIIQEYNESNNGTDNYTSSNILHSTNRYEWMTYVFEAIPELVLLAVLGGIILGDWFYDVPEVVRDSKIYDPETKMFQSAIKADS